MQSPRVTKQTLSTCQLAIFCLLSAVLSVSLGIHILPVDMPLVHTLIWEGRSMELILFLLTEIDVSGVDDSPLGMKCTCTQVASSVTRYMQSCEELCAHSCC